MKIPSLVSPRLAILGLVAGLSLLAGRLPAAAAGQEPTAIAVAAPASATIGTAVPVQARLVSAAGPIPHASVDFLVPASFLGTDGEMKVASGITDAQGLATATFEARITGALQVKAVFSGDNTYAPSTATSSMTVTGSKQLYVPDIGIRLRGLNSSPIAQSGTVSHWLLSGWPIGALLVLIWSTYGAAVFFMSRISADAANGPEAAR